MGKTEMVLSKFKGKTSEQDSITETKSHMANQEMVPIEIRTRTISLANMSPRVGDTIVNQARILEDIEESNIVKTNMSIITDHPEGHSTVRTLPGNNEIVQMKPNMIHSATKQVSQ